GPRCPAPLTLGCGGRLGEVVGTTGAMLPPGQQVRQSPPSPASACPGSYRQRSRFGAWRRISPDRLPLTSPSRTCPSPTCSPDEQLPPVGGPPLAVVLPG